jgi:large subunit ribosomal protein L29
MKAKEMRDWTDEELASKMDEMYQELFNLRFQLASGQLANPNRLSEVKRDIARARTILGEIEAGGGIS